MARYGGSVRHLPAALALMAIFPVTMAALSEWALPDYELCGGVETANPASDVQQPVSPRPVAFDPRGSGQVWVADNGNQKLLAFSLAGALQQEVPFGDIDVSGGGDALLDVYDMAWVSPSHLMLATDGHVALVDLAGSDGVSPQAQVWLAGFNFSHIAHDEVSGDMYGAEISGEETALYRLHGDSTVEPIAKQVEDSFSLASLMGTEDVYGLHSHDGTLYTLCRSCRAMVQASVAGKVLNMRRFEDGDKATIARKEPAVPTPDSFTFTPGGEYLIVVTGTALRYYCHSTSAAFPTSPQKQALRSSGNFRKLQPGRELLPTDMEAPAVVGGDEDAVLGRDEEVVISGDSLGLPSFNWSPSLSQLAPGRSPFSRPASPSQAGGKNIDPSASLDLNAFGLGSGAFSYGNLAYQANPAPIVWPLEAAPKPRYSTSSAETGVSSCFEEKPDTTRCAGQGKHFAVARDQFASICQEMCVNQVFDSELPMCGGFVFNRKARTCYFFSRDDIDGCKDKRSGIATTFRLQDVCLPEGAPAEPTAPISQGPAGLRNCFVKSTGVSWCAGERKFFDVAQSQDLEVCQARCYNQTLSSPCGGVVFDTQKRDCYFYSQKNVQTCSITTSPDDEQFQLKEECVQEPRPAPIQAQPSQAVAYTAISASIPQEVVMLEEVGVTSPSKPSKVVDTSKCFGVLPDVAWCKGQRKAFTVMTGMESAAACQASCLLGTFSEGSPVCGGFVFNSGTGTCSFFSRYIVGQCDTSRSVGDEQHILIPNACPDVDTPSPSVPAAKGVSAAAVAAAVPPPKATPATCFTATASQTICGGASDELRPFQVAWSEFPYQCKWKCLEQQFGPSDPPCGGFTFDRTKGSCSFFSVAAFDQCSTTAASTELFQLKDFCKPTDSGAIPIAQCYTLSKGVGLCPSANKEFLRESQTFPYQCRQRCRDQSFRAGSPACGGFVFDRALKTCSYYSIADVQGGCEETPVPGAELYKLKADQC